MNVDLKIECDLMPCKDILNTSKKLSMADTMDLVFWDIKGMVLRGGLLV